MSSTSPLSTSPPVFPSARRCAAACALLAITSGGCMLDRAGGGVLDRDAPDGVDAGPIARVDGGDAGSVGVDAGRDAGRDASVRADSGPDRSDAGRDAGPTCDPLACPGRRCAETGACDHYVSCAELHASHALLGNGVYEVLPSGATTPLAVFCEMESDGGGWTLLLKVDGEEATFRYNAARWTDSSVLNPTSLDLERTEAKLPGFDAIPFAEMRVAFRLSSGDSTIRAAHFALPAASLLELFTRSEAPSIPLSRAEWLALVPGSALQPNCSASGINITGAGFWGRVRIGIVGNEQDNCNDTDSFVGIGGCEAASCAAAVVSAGNAARFNGSGGSRNVGAFAYVFVR